MSSETVVEGTKPKGTNRSSTARQKARPSHKIKRGKLENITVRCPTYPPSNSRKHKAAIKPLNK